MTSETFSDALTAPTAINEIIIIEININPRLTFIFLFSSYKRHSPIIDNTLFKFIN